MPDKNYRAAHARLQGLFARLGQELPGPMAGFAHLRREALSDGALEAKTKELIALGISIAVHCDGCIAYHVHDALRAGATKEEVLDAIGVAIAMGGGPAAIYAAEAFDALGQFLEEQVQQ